MSVQHIFLDACRFAVPQPLFCSFLRQTCAINALFHRRQYRSGE
ncbi:Hypothetical protein SMB2099_4164 [Serratia marcescens SMB2099]|nr:Hypothetical protein SMB2099_4164 [Serratia marcescens SMB2099]